MSDKSEKTDKSVKDEPEVDNGIQVADPVTGQAANSAVISKNTKFFRGRFAAKANVNDPDSVKLSVQGEILVFQRDVDTIIPEPYLVVAQNAKHPKFTVEPGQGRKVVGWISRYPFNKTGEATYEEFKTLFDEGTRKTKDNIARFGLNIPVAEAVPQLI
jgi:hypothetical protein